MQETRQAILESIKRKDSTTVNDLAQELDLSPVTIRHHLYALMADELIERMPLRHGVGRPEHGYSLTEIGQRQFPSRYHVLTTHLLAVLKNMKSEADVRSLLETIVRQLLTAPEDSDGLTPRQRLHQLQTSFRGPGHPDPGPLYGGRRPGARGTALPVLLRQPVSPGAVQHRRPGHGGVFAPPHGAHRVFAKRRQIV